MNSVCGFDCFDTLICRDCHPDAVLFSWAKNLESKLEFSVTFERLYYWRKDIEIKEKSKKLIEDIPYNVLLEKLYNRCMLQGGDFRISKNDFCNISYSIELNLEINHCYLNQSVLALIKYAYHKGQKIILISDFYMGQNFFKDILKKFNILFYFDKIYISSDIGKRKSSGNLYKHILEDLNLNSSELTMYGDNIISDIKIPLSLGIVSKKICAPKPMKIFSEKELKLYLKRCLHCKKQEDLFTGYVAPMLLMMERLYRKAIEQKIDTLLFCSREGQNLKKLFDLYQKNIYSENLVNTEYFYVSRRSTLLPSLKSAAVEDFEKIFRQYKELSIYDFLYSIGFEEKEIKAVLESMGCTELEIICDPKFQNSKLEKILINNKFLSIYNKKRKEQKAFLKEYILTLNKNNLDTVYLVDIGWKGTIQDNIFEIIREGMDIQGFYFGLVKKNEVSGNKKQGLMFEYNSCLKNFNLFSYNCIELEHVFAADHGQTLLYKKSGNYVYPVLSEKIEDVALFRYIELWQRNMNLDFYNVVQNFNNSLCDPEKLRVELSKIYAFHLCITEPRYYKEYLNFRKIYKENFGNITKIQFENKNNWSEKILKKSKYAFTDYVFRILDKLYLPFLKPLASCYCHIVYYMKALMIR